jgi:putative SOS response-associated peptidase YedK
MSPCEAPVFHRFGLNASIERVLLWADASCVPASAEHAEPHDESRTLFPVLRIGRSSGQREVAWMREGLIPSYACDERGAEQRTEAHAEAMTCESCFRSAFRRRRCIVPANILYEERHLSQGIEQPCSFALVSGGIFGIAGVWETWTNDQGCDVESFAIITVLVTPLLRTLFERMPVILNTHEEQERWLYSSRQDEPPVDLLKPLSVSQLRDWKMTTGAVDVQLNDPIPSTAV